MILEAKEESYHNFLRELDPQKDPGGPFRLLKTMDAPSGQPKDAALQGPTKAATSAKEKAELAIKHYVAINRVIRAKQADKEVRAASRPLKQCTPDCEYCTPFTLFELEAALHKQKGNAAGPDNVTPWMLRRCSSEAKLALLAMCNASWERAEIPEA